MPTSTSPFMRWWSSVGTNIEHYWLVGLSTGSFFGAAFLESLFTPWYRLGESLWLLGEHAIGLGIVALTAVSLYLGTRQAGQSARLRQENSRYKNLIEGLGRDLYEIWTAQLSSWARKLQFSGNERISVYKFSSDSFVMLGRFSDNPEFLSKGRGVYPQDQGCIGQAWRSADGSVLIQGLPDPETDGPAYEAAQRDQMQVPEDVQQALRMKPRSIAAFVIRNPTDIKRQAIVVFESLSPTRFNQVNLFAFMNEGGSRQVTLLMDAMQNQEPSIEVAAERGF